MRGCGQPQGSGEVHQSPYGCALLSHLESDSGSRAGTVCSEYARFFAIVLSQYILLLVVTDLFSSRK